jgi:hypothetical protein
MNTMLKWIVYLLFAAAYLLVTFFGLGPVLLADGTAQERWVTFLVVLLIYAVITVFLRWILKKFK